MSASGVPVWAEWWDDGAKVYLSAEDYENIRVFEPYRLARIVSIVNNRTAIDGGRSVTDVRKNKGYEDLPYIRSKVTSRDIVEAVREVLGVKEGEAIPLVFDGKVTPVVVLNDSIKYSRYDFKWKVDLVNDFSSRIATGGFEFRVTNSGYVYCLGWVNSVNIGCIDKNGLIVMDESDFFNLNIGAYESDYMCFIDSDNYPNEVNIYRNGERLCVIDVLSNLANLDTTNACYCSKNGKYVAIAAHESVGGNWYVMFYEGVV